MAVMIRSLLIVGLTAGLLGACGSPGTTQQEVSVSEIATAIDRPWPEAIEGVWEGVSIARRVRESGIEQEWQDTVRLTLADSRYSYSGSGPGSGQGDYTLDDEYLVLEQGIATLPYNPPLNLEGRFQYYYQDTVLILEQFEAIGQPVRDQAFMEKELTLRRTGN